jgi:hypothetical protein
MFYLDRATAQSKQGKKISVEPLEGRQLLSASLPNLSTAVGDFNGDGKADIASITTINLGKKSSASALVVQLGQGNGAFVTSSVQVLSGKPSAIVTGDFNGDKNHDIGLLTADASGQVSLTTYLGDGKGQLTAGATQSVGTIPLANVTAGDVNGDGFADLLSWNSSSVFVSLNDGTGKLLPAVQNDNPFGTLATPAGAGDLDGDGRPELLGVNGGQLLGNKATAATGIYQLTFLPTLGSSIRLDNKRLVVADVNGDGVNDLIAMGDGSVHVALQITQPGQDITFAPWVATKADIDPSQMLVGDVNGDGKADLFRLSSDINLVTQSKLVLIGNGDGTFHKLIANDHGHGNGHGDGDNDDDGHGNDHHNGHNDDHDHDNGGDHDRD